jgi:hypothetical protein
MRSVCLSLQAIINAPPSSWTNASATAERHIGVGPRTPSTFPSLCCYVRHENNQKSRCQPLQDCHRSHGEISSFGRCNREANLLIAVEVSGVRVVGVGSAMLIQCDWRRCLVALNSQISVATTSVTPPLKSAQVKKISSVTVIAASPRHAGPRRSRAQHCGRTRAAGSGEGRALS